MGNTRWVRSCVGGGRIERERAAGGEWKIFIFDCAIGGGGFVPAFCGRCGAGMIIVFDCAVDDGGFVPTFCCIG